MRPKIHGFLRSFVSFIKTQPGNEMSIAFGANFHPRAKHLTHKYRTVGRFPMGEERVQHHRIPGRGPAGKIAPHLNTRPKSKA